MSCCCDCCSSSYAYWDIPSTATCLLTGIQRLQEGETLESVCPIAHPSGECIEPGVYQAPEKYRREKLPVKGGQCDNLYPEPIQETPKKCYVCHDCLPACTGDIDGCIPTPDPCLEGHPYNCRKPIAAVWAAAPCFGAVQTQCTFCNANPRPNAAEDPVGAAQWDATCGAHLGTCHSAPATYCFTGDGPYSCGYYTNFTPENPYFTDCSQAPDCDDKGQPCGGGGPCTTPGHIECPLPCTTGPDTCGNSYTGCAAECVGETTNFCCPETSPNNCAGVPPECIFCA